MHVLVLAAAHHADHSGPPLILRSIVAAAVYAAGYAMSVRLHPWKPCKRCGESGKHRGSLFTSSFRSCARCGGTGRELRRFARLP